MKPQNSRRPTLALAGVLSCLLAAPAALHAEAPAPAHADAASANPTPAEAPAELVLRSAQIITMNPARPQASAVAVRQGRIVYVGDDAGVEAYVGPRTRVIAGSPPAAANAATAATATSGGREITVLPGLIDAHAHLISLGLSLGQLDLRGKRSIAEILAAARGQLAKETDPASRPEWLEGSGWDQNLFTPARYPGIAERHQLDAVTGKRPAFLRRIDGHAGWANSEALLRAGITRDSGDVAGGMILRDERGEPTGVLIDNAMALVERVIPSPSPAEIEKAILAASHYVTARGLTAVHEMGISSEAAAVYRRLAEEGRLPLRVYAFHDDPIPHSLSELPHSLAYKAELDHLMTRLGPPTSKGHFSMRGIKLYMDGALGSRGAALWEPYSDDPKQSGLLLTSPDHIEMMARWAILHGYQIATHAIGDRANQLVLDAYEHAGVRAELNLRFRVEHAQVLNQSDLTGHRYQKLGVIASIQPTHATSDMAWAGERLGPARLKLAYAWQALLHSGASICGGSDFPVEEADPRRGLHAAVLRQDLAGKPEGGFFPRERLSVGEAIRAFTSDAAYAAFAENELGRIEVGRPADLTLLQGRLELDPAAPLPRDLATRPVLLTLIDGYVVHDGLPRSVANLARRGPGKRGAAPALLLGKGRRLARLSGKATGG
jgi:predicted amidohydrolase YtcJ